MLNNLVKENFNVDNNYGDCSFKISNLKIFLSDVGVVGENNNSTPTKIVASNMTKIFGYSLFSSHKNNYMKYKSYASGNTVYAFCEDSSAGHSTIFFAIGI